MRRTAEPRALIAVGTGRYADPWHPFAENAAALGTILRSDGFDVRIDDDLDGALAALDGVDLLVVCAGDPWATGATGHGAPSESLSGLRAALDRGMGVLGVHSATASLRDYPDWAAAIGAVWLPEISMHPPRGDARVEALAHPFVDGIDSFTLVDERYCFLQLVGESEVVAEHEHGGLRHPLVWVREHGAARVAYDALGHDPVSYESGEHRELVRRLARWAARV
ncbi:ThuA domain-containing protein [Glaciibacter flavus]|uniref:ThuA domain-containing protein n=1 Tax=Orlajensenia flava TaxID=2565934 RepID=UPI003B00B23F